MSSIERNSPLRHQLLIYDFWWHSVVYWSTWRNTPKIQFT